MRVLSLFALAAPLVSAIQFLEPVANSTLKKGETYSVKWSSVDTDPTTFSLFLVNFVDWPPFYTQVASDVQTTEGEHEVTVPCDVNTSWGFQFNAINGTNVYVIHAQTSKFFVEDGVCSGSGPVQPPPTSSAAATCTATTVTETVTSTVTESPSCSLLSSTSTPAASSSTTVVATSSESATTSKTTVAVPSSKSDTSAQATVTSPPSISKATTATGTTSTITSTVYKDLSEVEDCPALCAA
ncbi:hypothetical protein N657DRAFT_630103 [Parathielavia appendiculata]|uniref:Yeast cell wall synthesis Kre9/Knh1-like N-terminal domain-containing protein n=1 Tax=Parathielavia appendiculata TaxID=2587402 RepID=A0AAN6UA32_9PEZI|nr:hypothetical protein N657DRAFT_630103 [Parathielavia appendiculata]